MKHGCVWVPIKQETLIFEYEDYYDKFYSLPNEKDKLRAFFCNLDIPIFDKNSLN
jgi:hypothetical protein